MNNAVFIIDITAFKFWRWWRCNKNGVIPAASHLSASPSCAYTYAEVQRLLSEELALDKKGIEVVLGAIVHIGTDSSAHRSQSERLVSKVIDFHREEISFCKVSPHVYVASPATCVRQLIPYAPLERSLLVAMEFCGTFAYNTARDEYQYHVSPIMTREDLRFALNRACSRSIGGASPSSIVQWVLEGSASVMESCAGLLLTLPYRRGGFSLRGLLLNPYVDKNGDVVEKRTPECLRPDLYFPNAHVAIEYNSSRFHPGIDEYAKDMERREELERRGISVISLTPEKLYDVDKLAEIASLIARRSGTRLQLPNGFWEKHARLRTMLLPR